MRNGLIIRGHLGLGDHIVCNALVRFKANPSHNILLPCKSHNCESVRFMFQDLKNVFVIPVGNDEEADMCVEWAMGIGCEKLGLGMFGDKPFNIDQWDSEFYRQAGLPFSYRWERFTLPPLWDEMIPMPVPLDPYIFVHDDPFRGFAIDAKHLPEKFNIVRPTPGATNNIFSYKSVIENAAEIHCIDSSFAILADSIPVKAKRLVWHKYARVGRPPTYLKPWEVIQ